MGDVLLAAAFVAYAGPFNAALRQELVAEAWVPELRARGIPLSDPARPLDLLTDDATKVPYCLLGTANLVLIVVLDMVLLAHAIHILSWLPFCKAQ